MDETKGNELRRIVQSIMELYGPHPLHKLAEVGNTDDMLFLLNSGFTPNDSNYDCITPLHVACNHKQYKCAEILIQYGAQIEATSIDGGTPLCDACATGSVLCAQLLLNHGANVNPPLILTSPLHEACMAGSSEIASLLIRAGARLNVNDCHFGTPLHAAAMMNHPHCIKVLLDAGASVNAAKIHQTALHVAALFCLYDVAKILLEYGANVYASNNQNKLPIDLLPEEHGPLKDLLLEYATQPRKLTDYCRRTIRACLGSQRLKDIPHLNLPNRLKLYLCHA